MQKPEEGMLNIYREDSGKFRVDCFKTVQIYKCFLDLIHLFVNYYKYC